MLRKPLLLLICFLFAVAASAQEKVYMPFFEVINMNKGYQYATSRLLKSYLLDNKKYDLLLPAKTDSNYTETLATTKENAKKAGANAYLIGELNRIGETVIVRLSLYNTASDTLIWTDKMKADNPDDLDPIMERLAGSFGEKNTTAADNQNIYTITEQDSRALKKIESNYYYGLSIGSILDFSSINGQFSSGLGFSAMYDTRKMLIDLTAQGYWGDRLDYYLASIEAYYAFKDKKTTPFIGGGFAYSRTNADLETNYSNYSDYSDGTGTGLLALVGGGYLFNRTGNVNLRLSANAVIGLYDVTVSSNSYDFATQQYTSYSKTFLPIGALIKMQVLFQR